MLASESLIEGQGPGERRRFKLPHEFEPLFWGWNGPANMNQLIIRERGSAASPKNLVCLHHVS
jgi:hypothetical protein